MVAPGVDGIISDYPDYLRAAGSDAAYVDPGYSAP